MLYRYLCVFGLFASMVFSSFAGAISLKEQLDRLLDQRRTTSDLSARARIDREIKSRFGRHLAVMVTDTEGMTSLTAADGIGESLSRIRNMLGISLPAIWNREAKLVKTVADDMFIVHTRDEMNVDAMLEMPRSSVCELYTLARELLFLNRKQDINLAIGIDFGEVLYLDDDIWGNPVNVASKLGEDKALAGEILLSENAYARMHEELILGECCEGLEELTKCEAPFCRHVISDKIRHYVIRP